MIRKILAVLYTFIIASFGLFAAILSSITCVIGIVVFLIICTIAAIIKKLNKGINND